MMDGLRVTWRSDRGVLHSLPTVGARCSELPRLHKYSGKNFSRFCPFLHFCFLFPAFSSLLSVLVLQEQHLREGVMSGMVSCHCFLLFSVVLRSIQLSLSRFAVLGNQLPLVCVLALLPSLTLTSCRVLGNRTFSVNV